MQAAPQALEKAASTRQHWTDCRMQMGVKAARRCKLT